MNLKTGRPRPIDRENEFLINEIFFSTTDPIGNITYGNSVFIRVSQYEKNELIGAAHNIVRHPDMPRVVFRILWEYLKVKKPVVAYVKNMTKQGRYYWVLAAAFPVPKGYLSIRIKPSSEIFKLIPSVYNKLLTVEETGGMDASFNSLLEIIKTKGFDSYDAFMATVLVEELNSRQKLMHSSENISEKNIRSIQSNQDAKKQEKLIFSINEIRDLCHYVTTAFEKLFQDFDKLLDVEERLKQTSQSVLSFSEQISILSLNVNINSYFAGETGRTLSVVAKTIKNKTEEVESFTQLIVKFSKDISSQAQRLGFQISTPRLQIAMINAFIQEIYDQSFQRNIHHDELEEMKGNISVLINLFMNTFSQLTNLLVPINGKIDNIVDLIASINKSIYELERCNFLGNIEAAVIGNEGVKFNFTFAEIKTSTETTKQCLLDFRSYLTNVGDTIQVIQTTNAYISSQVMLIKKAVDKINIAKEEAVVFMSRD